MEKEKSTSENFAELISKFGSTVSEIFNDPKLKKKAKEFGDGAAQSAKAFKDRFNDDEVKKKFKDLGKAAKDFGESVSEHFKDEKDPHGKKKDDKTENDINQEEKYVEGFSGHKEKYERVNRSGRITGYSLSIAWSTVIVVFLNYFNQYIAYYQGVTEGGKTEWSIIPLITQDFKTWLPIVTAALIVSIIGNILLIIFDSYLLDKVTYLVINIFGIAAVATLLSIFPFDFGMMPQGVASIVSIIVSVVLIITIVGMSVGIIVKFIKLIVYIARRS